VEVSNIFTIGKFQFPEQYSPEDIRSWVQEIEVFPYILKETLHKIPESYYNYSYRPGGWSIKQIVHHIAESHLNAFIRFKLTLTEDNPIIKPYDQDKWSQLSDYNISPSVSILLIESIHTKWSALLSNIDHSLFKKTYYHPEYNKEFNLAHVIALYSWDGKHHLSQILRAAELKYS
jgi:hypothetical protein